MSDTKEAEAELQNERDLSEVLNKHGITMTTINYFHIGEYRYTSLEDAVAEAKRRGKVI